MRTKTRVQGHSLHRMVVHLPMAIHVGAGLLATLLIGAFFISTAVVELLGSHEAIAEVKSLIVMPGLVILVPAIALTAASGVRSSSSRGDTRAGSKKKRMPFIAANGLLVLIPCAILLERFAAAGRFDQVFYLVQSVELLAGAVNFSLMSMNIRDGIRLSGRLRKRDGRPVSRGRRGLDRDAS